MNRGAGPGTGAITTTAAAAAGYCCRYIAAAAVATGAVAATVTAVIQTASTGLLARFGLLGCSNGGLIFAP
jgi:hypothetical protein